MSGFQNWAVVLLLPLAGTAAAVAAVKKHDDIIDRRGLAIGASASASFLKMGMMRREEPSWGPGSGFSPEAHGDSTISEAPELDNASPQTDDGSNDNVKWHPVQYAGAAHTEPVKYRAGAAQVPAKAEPVVADPGEDDTSEDEPAQDVPGPANAEPLQEAPVAAAAEPVKVAPVPADEAGNGEDDISELKKENDDGGSLYQALAKPRFKSKHADYFTVDSIAKPQFKRKHVDYFAVDSKDGKAKLSNAKQHKAKQRKAKLGKAKQRFARVSRKATSADAPGPGFEGGASPHSDPGPPPVPVAEADDGNDDDDDTIVNENEENNDLEDQPQVQHDAAPGSSPEVVEDPADEEVPFCAAAEWTGKCAELGKVFTPRLHEECSDAICTEHDCCTGTCGDGSGAHLCDANQPLAPISSLPAACKGLHCTRDECCVDTCKGTDNYVCSADLFLRDKPEPCKGKSCMEPECCVARCSEDSCLATKGLMLNKSVTEDHECKSTSCTEDECCVGVCSDIDCPADSVFKHVLTPLVQPSCADEKCTPEECCIGVCSANHCLKEKGLTLKASERIDHETQPCQTTKCTMSECCADLGTCNKELCNDNQVPKIPLVHEDYVEFCKGETCENAECCADHGKCDSNVCTSFEMVLHPLASQPAKCKAHICAEDECCGKKKNVYWIEKTSGTIKRCRYDKCNHDDVTVVKDGLKAPEGLAFDTNSRLIYWANTDENKIQRCDPDNCNDSTEDMVGDGAADSTPLRLAIDEEAGFLYWSEKATNKVLRCPTNAAPCGRPEVVVDSGNGDPYGIAFDPDSKMLYWGGSSKIQRCSVADRPLSCQAETVVGASNKITGPHPSLEHMWGMALDLKKRKVYWSSKVIEDGLTKTKIEEVGMEKDQTEENISPVTSSVDMVRGLAVDPVSGVLYMADGSSSGAQSRIRQLIGVNTQILINGCPASGCMNMPYDVALDWSEKSLTQESYAAVQARAAAKAEQEKVDAAKADTPEKLTPGQMAYTPSDSSDQ